MNGVEIIGNIHLLIFWVQISMRLKYKYNIYKLYKLIKNIVELCLNTNVNKIIYKIII